MKKYLFTALLFVASIAYAADSPHYSQTLTNIFTPSEKDGIHLIEPDQSIEQSFALPTSSIPQRITLRVRGNTLMPQPFTHRGEEYFRRCETILDDNLDGEIRMKDKYSLYFKGNNDSFERLAWNRILSRNLKTGRITVSIPVVKSENLSVDGSGRFGVELGLYFKKAGRHELDVFDDPDSTIFISVPQGSYQKKTIRQEIDLPEKTACILLAVGGVKFSGECWLESPSLLDGRQVLWHMPFLGRKVDEEGWAYKDLDYFKDEINYWVSTNMSERWWPYWRITFNGETVADGKIFDRCSNIADFYVPLPESASDGGTLKLTLVDEPHRQNYPYQLRGLDIIQEPERAFEIICPPKYVSEGSDFGVLIETNKADITISANADEAVSPQHQTVTFHEPGLHVLKFKALSSKSNVPLTISDSSRDEECEIQQIITKGNDGVYLSVGDDIYIDKNYEDYSRYFKWYLSARAGNWLQFRPSYQWSGVREIDVDVVKYFTGLMNDLQMPYAWQVDGRTFPGVHINPSNDELQSPLFRGKQAHENDGGFYYWDQFQYQGLQSDMAAKTRPYGGIFAKKRPIFTDHGAFIHYDTQYAEDMAMGAEYFVENLRYSKGESSRHTGPSSLFRYFYQAGYDWCGAEQMYGPEDVIMSSLRGASRAYSRPVYGSLHAMQWNNGPYTLPEHSLVHYMSLAVGYMHGSSHLNTEDALWTDEYLNDRFTESGKAHLCSQNKILDFIQTHTRRGEFHTRIGIVQGRNDSWLSFKRGNAWSQEGDKWAFGDAAKSFDLLKIFYPNCNLSFCKKEHMFSNAPYGPVDLFPIEAPQDQMDSYGLIIFLGWNTYNREDFERLRTYVHRGGTLILTSAHINANLQPDEKPEFPTDDAPVRAMLGEDYKTLTGIRHIAYGNGRIIYFACPEYPANESIIDGYVSSIKEQATEIIAEENSNGWIDSGDHTDFTVWQKGNHRTIYLLDTDWKNPSSPSVCHLLYGENRYPVSVPCGALTTIHCMEGLAVYPESNTTDVLDIKKTEKGWTVSVQTTGEDSFKYFTRDGSLSGAIRVSKAGIHQVCIEDNWELAWSEEFNGTVLDESVWSRTERGKADWANTQSKRPDLLEIHDGVLVLKGIVNDKRIAPADFIDGKITADADTARFLTGGIVTDRKKSFAPEGRIEVRAKLQGAQGAWPAIWLMPFERDGEEWPTCGEIDIMERLSHEDIAYQTVHSLFTSHEPGNSEPRHGTTGKISPDDWNIYGVEFHQNSLTFTINGEKTFSYHRLDTPEAVDEKQFPFIKPWYMLIDMQLGGGWVGNVDPDQLPVKMEVDWVRHYIVRKDGPQSLR